VRIHGPEYRGWRAKTGEVKYDGRIVISQTEKRGEEILHSIEPARRRGIGAPRGRGKNYAVIQMLKYFSEYLDRVEGNPWTPISVSSGRGAIEETSERTEG
jgi:hypothetical protein